MGVARYKQYTPVSAPRGRIIHALDLHQPAKTVCGKKMRGWKISLRLLGCRDCKLAIDQDCRAKRKKRKRRR